MKKNDNRGEKRRDNPGGIRANNFMMLMVILFIFLYVLIISLFMKISRVSASLSETMQKSSSYIEEATSILGGSSLLSETSSNFILVPVTESGEINLSPLIAYAGELESDRRGPQVAERFQGYEVSDEVREKINTAADAAQFMLDAQLHAMALVTSVYPLPPQTPASEIPIPELSKEEQDLPEEAKLGLAHSLILGQEYGQNKSAVSSNINESTGMIKAAMGQKSAQTAKRIGILRKLLWVATALTIITLFLVFFIIYRQVLHPLIEFTRLINSANPLTEKKGLLEVRKLAAAYNGLLRRRDALDQILRSAAVTDTLTNLPNRYGYEQYILELQDGSHAIALLLFDVNYLKITNDTYGHAAGDELLRSSAECISSCFGSSAEHNCFRFGGDEFAAVVKDASPADVQKMVRQFQEDQKKRDISIAWGCAYTDDIAGTNFKEMMAEADREMYEQKRELHDKES